MVGGSEQHLVHMVSSFGETILMMRRRTGLTVERLAYLARVAPNTLRNYEADKSVPDALTLRKLDRVLREELRIGDGTDELWHELGLVLDRHDALWVPTKQTRFVTPVSAVRLVVVASAVRLGVDPEALWEELGRVLEQLADEAEAGS